MSRSYDNEKKPSQSTFSFKPTASFLQTRGFAPIQTDLDEDAAPRPSGYTENFLEKIINQRSTESSDTPVQPKPMNRLRRPLQDKRMSVIQAKLSIGEPNDKYEQEADATASKVVQQINSPTQDQSVQREAMEELQMKPISSIQREAMEEEEELQMKPISSIQREAMEEEEELQMKPISSIQREESMEEEEELQMKSLVQRRENLGGGEASNDLESSIQNARGSGQPLDPNLQAKMGQAIGADFSGVKVHTDSQADQLNQSIQAKAFTTGQDVFFRQGAYSPSSRDGQELIAHELTHVVQQNPDRSSNTIQRLMKPDRFNEITTLDTDSGFSSLFSAGRNKIKLVDDALTAYDGSKGLEKIEKLKAVIKACEDYLVIGETAKRKVGVNQLLSDAKQELSVMQRDSYLELRGVSTNYDTEQTVQRPDLAGAVTGMAGFIKKMYEMRERLDALDPTNAPGLLDVKNMLPSVSPLRTTIDPMDKDATRSVIDDRHKVMLEKCLLQEIVVDEKGDLDQGALDTRLVEYDKTPEEQNKTLVSISGGTLTRSGTHDTAPGAAVDTTGSVTQHTGKGWEIFVMSPSGDLHMASHKIGKYHHSSLLGGGATAAAGTIKASGGRITQMNDKSGHYRPTKQQTIQACHMLAKKGVDLNTVQLEVAAEGFNGLANAFLTAGETNNLEYEMTYKTLMHFMNIKGIPAVQTAFAEEGWEMKYQAGRWHIFKAPNVEANHEEVRSLLHMKFQGESPAPTRKRFDPPVSHGGTGMGEINF